MLSSRRWVRSSSSWLVGSGMAVLALRRETGPPSSLARKRRDLPSSQAGEDTAISVPPAWAEYHREIPKLKSQIPKLLRLDFGFGISPDSPRRPFRWTRQTRYVKSNSGGQPSEYLRGRKG